MGDEKLKKVYIPNIKPNWVVIDGNNASVQVPWSAQKKQWGAIYCDAAAVVDGDHPAVAPVSRENTKAVELYSGLTYYVYHDDFVDKMKGLDIARATVSDKELLRQGFVPDKNSLLLKQIREAQADDESELEKDEPGFEF